MDSNKTVGLPARVLRGIVDVLSSFSLSVVTLVGLLVVTWQGTEYQVLHGLHAAQRKFFDSWFVWNDVFGVHVPVLPGGYLLMAVLFVNLMVGGIVRLKRTWSRVGILIVHVGIAMMLFAGFVKFHYSTEGGIQLYEGQTSARFVSYTEWEVAIIERLGDGETREFLFDAADIVGSRPAASTVLRHDDLPFDVRVDEYLVNSRIRRKGPMFTVDTPVVDGAYLERVAPHSEAEFNAPGAYVTAIERGGREHDGIVWSYQDAPWSIEVDGGRVFAVDLRKHSWELPFSIRLEDFQHEFHPGTRTPRLFRSDVTVVDGDDRQAVRIEMNQPLRRSTYVVYQSTWGPQNARPGEPLFSGLAVVENPSDQWPLYSCIVIGIGLIFHFSRMLTRYVRRETGGVA